MRSMFSKPVDKCQANYSDIEDQEAADVGDTCVEGLGPLFSRSNAHDSLEDQNVGKTDDEKVQQDHCKYNNYWVETIEGDVSTG